MANNVHDIINGERKKRGLSHIYWSKELAHLAQSQANYCAKVGHMVHSDRYAFQGGECLCGGKGNFSPRTIVNTWLKSKAGHREYLLSPSVTKAGVGIARRNGKMFAAWAFSGDGVGSLPNPIEIMSKTGEYLTRFITRLEHKISRGNKRRRGMLRIPVSLFAGFLGALGIALGIHGLYAYFNLIPTIVGGDMDKLFLHFEVPIRLRGAVEWASIQGVQSWFVPALILVAGIVVWNWSGIFGLISGWLTRLKLW